MKYREKYGSKDEFIAYVELVGKVRKIDPAAADYLESKELRKNKSFVYSGDIFSSFSWLITPQGHAYWHNIAQRLGGI